MSIDEKAFQTVYASFDMGIMALREILHAYEAAKLPEQPVSVSLDRCVQTLQLSRKDYETYEEMAQAVLDAAGVPYVD